MSNSNLNCSVSNCAHNNSGACFAGSINVAGSSATTTSSTCCSSYEDKLLLDLQTVLVDVAALKLVI